MKIIKLIDSYGNDLHNGDNVYVCVSGYFGQICNVDNGKIDFSPIKNFTYPRYMDLDIKKIIDTKS